MYLTMNKYLFMAIHDGIDITKLLFVLAADEATAFDFVLITLYQYVLAS